MPMPPRRSARSRRSRVESRRCTTRGRTRRNIPTAETSSLMADAEAAARRCCIRATPTSTRSSSGAARTSRTGATSRADGRRSTSRRRCTRGADRRPPATVESRARDAAGRSVRRLQRHRRAETSWTSIEHDENWSNRMILGDSLQVMASLAEKEGLRGKVQCIYIDPPYGIKFDSNLQWCTRPARREGRQRRTTSRASRSRSRRFATPGATASTVPHVPARSADRRARSARRDRLDLRADRRRECASRTSADGRGIWAMRTSSRRSSFAKTRRRVRIDCRTDGDMSLVCARSRNDTRNLSPLLSAKTSVVGG